MFGNNDLQIDTSFVHVDKYLLPNEQVYQYDLPQVTNPTQKTKMLILCDGSVTKADLKANIGKVTTPQGLYFENFGDVVSKLKPIPSVD